MKPRIEGARASNNANAGQNTCQVQSLAGNGAVVPGCLDQGES